MSIFSRNNGKIEEFFFLNFVCFLFERFTQAANAFENCGSKYRAVFAEPKGSGNARSGNNSSDRNSRYDDHMMSSFGGSGNMGSRNRSLSNEYANFLNAAVYPSSNNSATNTSGNGSNPEVQLNIICCSSVSLRSFFRGLFSVFFYLNFIFIHCR